MAEPKLELVVAQVEMALEEGDPATAMRLLSQAKARLGPVPELVTLERRIAEVGERARRPEVEALVQRAQSRLRAADYAAAIEPLEQAAAAAPGDERIRALLDRARRAVERHSAALERQQAAVKAARELRRLIDAGQLAEARERLRDAQARLGRQSRLERMGQRLEEAVERIRSERAEEHVRRSRERLGAGDLHGALNQVEQAHALVADEETARLRELIKDRLGESEGRRQRHSALQKAIDDVERLIGAGELVRADERLRRATDELGQEAAFEKLARRIDETKKDKDLRTRVEWAERRSREADARLEEAARAEEAGHLDRAVDLLELCRRLDPSRPGVEERLARAREALERERSARNEAEQLQRTLEGIRGHLDALRLGEARHALAEAERRFEAAEQLGPLRRRLGGLEAAEQDAGVLPGPANLDTLGIAARSAIARRQESVASAYSWKQAFLYPLRGAGPAWLAGLFALSLAAALTDAGQLMGGAGLASWTVLPFVMPLLTLWLAPHLARATLEGKNQPPPIRDLLSGGSGLGDAAVFFAALLLFALPLGLLLASRGELGWLQASSDAFQWGLAAALLWGRCAMAVPACAVLAAFGRPWAWRMDLHWNGLRLGGGSLFAAHVLFAGITLLVMLRAAFLADLPYLAGPAVAALEAYGLLVLPHLASLPLRGRRLEWAEAYM
ncbi:MAG: hypothetical protein MI919_04450 [Holophagales bacterium]|nr:hypothetical protein [Holophagales bacterium]